MGFISRRVVPTFANLCIFCPALRTRSRQPVKRYKKLLSDVLQEELPNDRKISKLCDYAFRNPLRLPKIAKILEQRGYKAIRNEQFGSVRIMVAVYIKLFSACKDQMPLFAMSAITMIAALLDQDRQKDMCVFGCTMLFEFAYNQVDGTYFYQLDALVPNLCSIAQIIGQEQRQRQLRSAGLRALSALIWYMGEQSHMPSDYNCVISVIMDNYGHPFVTAHDNASVVEIPSVWAQLCVEKISQFCKEATTTRRFLEPLLVYFDMGKHWSPRHGLALTVLQQVLHFVESFGNDCFLLAVLVRHLDHKSSSQEPYSKADVVSISACLARQSKSKATVVEIGVLSDMLRLLQNTLQASLEGSFQLKLERSQDLQLAIQDFLAELVKKIGDWTPIFDIMALTLETLPSAAMSSQSTICSVLILASLLASKPASQATHQCFPEALLHQLSLAMVYPDSDSRTAAHQVFETILFSLASPEEKDTTAGSDTLTKADDKILFTTALARDSANVHCRLKSEAVSSLDCGSLHSNRKPVTPAIRLSEDQVGLVFSSLWSESNLDNNLPANYEANYWTFTLTLLFSPARVSKHIITWAFQLSLSLRIVAFEMSGRVSPSRQRSLLMLSSAMLAFASEFYSIPGIPDHLNALLARGQIDPYLELVESGLRVTDRMDVSYYGTIADNAAASAQLDLIRKEIDLSNESLVSLISSNLSTSFELEPSSLREDLLQIFSPVNDGFASGLDIQSKRSRPWTVVLQKSGSFNEVIESEDKFTTDVFCTDLPEILAKNPIRTPSADVIGATQLLESALEIAGQIAGTPVAAALLPFSDVATKCEHFHSNLRRKAPIWTNIDGCYQTLPWMSSDHIELVKANELSEQKDHGVDNSFLMKALQVSIDEPWQIFQLPPASHYDNFLKAASWPVIREDSPRKQLTC